MCSYYFAFSSFLSSSEDNVSGKRMQDVFRQIRERAGDVIDPATGKVVVTATELRNYRAHIVSVNNFPTAAGLASSASGFACLVFSLAQVCGSFSFTFIARHPCPLDVVLCADLK